MYIYIYILYIYIYPTSNIAIIGDFNAAIDTHFDVELQDTNRL